ncbi:MAG: phosphoribosyltransferase [Anaerolineales bacterium]|nr:phosphoribosyltransferase [Anaerolineales bacterium]
MKGYDYAQRKGIEEISWERFGELYQAIVEWLGDKRIDIVIGIARAGLFPATAVACALRRELYPIRVTRRVNDIVQYQSPIWRVDVSSMVTGQRVAVIDEIADSGETLALVASRALERGARQVWTVSLIAHSWADPQPDFTALVSDALVIFPWDKQVYSGGSWQLHPEIDAAIKAQNRHTPNG